MTLDRDRLAKVAGLLASDKMGERAAAAAKASEILQRAGLTWDEVLRPVPGPRTMVVVPPDTSATDAEIAGLRGALVESERRRRNLARVIEAERSVFWIGRNGGPSIDP